MALFINEIPEFRRKLGCNSNPNLKFAEKKKLVPLLRSLPRRGTLPKMLTNLSPSSAPYRRPSPSSSSSHRRRVGSNDVFQWDYTPLVLIGSARLILAG